MRFLFIWVCALCIVGCSGPIEPTAPFIKVTVEAPLVGTAPLADEFKVLVEAVIEGEEIQKELEIPTTNLPLPLDFVILFSEEIRGQAISISLSGFANGVDVYSGTTSGIADSDEVVLVAHFCGDQETNDDRGETCDDGANNSDILPDACRTFCGLPSCGDGVIDAGEGCDDANVVNEDGCSDVCQQEECGDGVIQSALGEACDDGANNSDTATDACRTNCQTAFCGDGVTDQDEDCDDANNIADDGCDPGCLATVVQVSAGGSHTCILTRSGKIKCWGEGGSGQLGYGNTNDIGDDETPDSVGFVDIGGVATQISAGGSHTCVLLDTGNVRCWGRAFEGQLGYGNTNNIGDNETPASIFAAVNVGGAISRISAGGNHTCALLVTGDVRCWGLNASGQLGYGNITNIGDNENPTVAGNVDIGGIVTQITTGNNHTCALLDTGNVRCWGSNQEQPGFVFDGRLGYGNINSVGDTETPSSVGDINVGGFVNQVSAGNTHTCVVLISGAVRCWGGGKGGDPIVTFVDFGQLGYGNTNNIGDNEDPAIAGDVNVGGLSVQVVTGRGRTCALLVAGNVRCWGDAGTPGFSTNRPLGYGNITIIGDNESPDSAGDISVGGVIKQIEIGDFHICALLHTGDLRCWGVGARGELGYGNINDIGDDELPSDVGSISLF